MKEPEVTQHRLEPGSLFKLKNQLLTPVILEMTTTGGTKLRTEVAGHGEITIEAGNDIELLNITIPEGAPPGPRSID
jgi:hypothetical protein